MANRLNRRSDGRWDRRWTPSPIGALSWDPFFKPRNDLLSRQGWTYKQPQRNPRQALPCPVKWQAVAKQSTRSSLQQSHSKESKASEEVPQLQPAAAAVTLPIHAAESTPAISQQPEAEQALQQQPQPPRDVGGNPLCKVSQSQAAIVTARRRWKQRQFAVRRRQARKQHAVHHHECQSSRRCPAKYRRQDTVLDQELSGLLQLVQQIKVLTGKIGSIFGKTSQPAAFQTGGSFVLARHSLDSITLDLEELLPCAHGVERAVKVLVKAASCPISLARLRTPMLAPDGQTYERSCIKEWLKSNSTSPISREPLRPEQLVRNRTIDIVKTALSFLPKPMLAKEGFDEDSEGEDEDGVLEMSQASEGPVNAAVPGAHRGTVPAEPQPLGLDLLTTIESRQVDQALEMLQQPLEEAVLEGVYGENRATLLQIALVMRLPGVALALVSKLSLRKLKNYMGQAQPAISALHLAAALGEVAVCQALLQRLGSSEPLDLVLYNFDLVSCGEELHFHRSLDACEIAELNHQPQTAAFLEGVAREWVTSRNAIRA